MATGTTAQELVDVVTPAAGESVTEGVILEWRVKVGDFIKRDDTIVEISTDKVDVELPSPASGTVVELLIEEGETVTVGQVIARISPGDSASDGAAGNGSAAAEKAPSGAPEQAPPGAPEQAPPGAPEAQRSATATAGDGRATGEGVKASPVAVRVAAAEGVDLSRVSGSGPAGRITKADVLSASGDGSPAPSC
jgi:2-oxoglutarate dehydrogenase E1 component